jgi:hypothetical protein
VKTADTTTTNTSLARRVFCFVVWLPYAALVFCVWGLIFDLDRGRWHSDLLFGTFIVTALVPFVVMQGSRVGVGLVRDRMRLRGRSDECPHCGYTLAKAGDQLCSECGMVSTSADRTAPTRAGRALRDGRWLRRFVIAFLVGAFGGWLLVVAENTVARRYARVAFAEPTPTAPPALTPQRDLDPPWVSGLNRYKDVAGGRLFYDYSSGAPDAYVVGRMFRLERRITPWRFVGPKYVDESGGAFLAFD